jgi:hypothetical protein
VQEQQGMAHYESCHVSDEECTQAPSLRVAMTANVGYLFVLRGRFGTTGQISFSLNCENVSGQLPSWTGKGANTETLKPVALPNTVPCHQQLVRQNECTHAEQCAGTNQEKAGCMTHVMKSE